MAVRRRLRRPSEQDGGTGRKPASPRGAAEMYRFVAEEIGRRAQAEIEVRSALARERARREAAEREAGLREELARANADRRVAKLRARLDRATDELARRTDELRQVRGELHEARREAERRGTEIVEVRAELEGRLRDLQSGHDHSMTRSMAELESLREETASLTQRIGVLTRQVGVRDARIRELEQALQAANGAIEASAVPVQEPTEDRVGDAGPSVGADQAEPGNPARSWWRWSRSARREARAQRRAARSVPSVERVEAAAPSAASPPSTASYEALVERIRRIVHERLPEDAHVAVVSKGDPQLVSLGRGHAVHFPQAEDGGYAGYYPFDGGAAINHLEDVRSRGVQFLLIPSTASWWLEHYPAFRDHLELRYTTAWADDACTVFDLRTERTDELLDLPGGNGTDVICFPIIDWDFRFQRSQQLLSRFAANGHRVLYVRTTFQGESPRPVVSELAEGIAGVQLPGPPHLNLYRDSMDDAVVDQMLGALEHLKRAAGIRNAMCVVSLPFWGKLALAARARWGWKVVYDCMDDHSGFSTNGPEMLREEQVLSAKSDLVLTSSQLLHERISPVARKTLLLRNAADFEHFSRPPATRPLDDVDGPVVGYFGAISEWFDVEMVYRAAAARPDWTFVLIGDTFGADVEWLRSLENVRLLGEQPYDGLPGYLHRFDVACIPFRLTPLTLATNPVKFYEYLSAGTPVVSVDLPELAPYREHYSSATADDFVEQLDRAMAEDSAERRRDRIEFAREQSWGHRYESLVAEIAPWYPKASVVILTYTLEPTYVRRCLDSIWSETDYPNYEVVVVDNGSAPEVVDYLTAAEAVEPRLRVILNDENLGFARGNNVGIRACPDADHVVLLNDDTMVTRGWLSGLVRYLSDERIGMVGPVTNWTGNEARIEIGYREIADMPAFAERYTREHAGESFDIGVLAMFCVGIRKRLLDRLGGLDERFGLGMFEDDDYAMRVRKAWYRVVCAEDIFVHHWGRATMSRLDQDEYRRLFERNKRYYEEKWGPWSPHRAREGIREEFSWQPH